MTEAHLSGRPAREFVAQGIRAAIRRGDMVPGQRLVEAELIEMFNVTRASARDALHDLSADGLVELIPGRGARVRRISVQEAVQITECRIALEVLCVGLAAELGTDEQREHLVAIGEGMQEAVDTLMLEKYSALNRELHETITEMSQQEVAADLLRRLNGQMVRHQFKLSMRMGRPGVSLPQHIAIIRAIAKGDKSAAEKAMTEHLRSVIEALKEFAQ